MGFRLFKYRFKIALRNKENMFWALFFPIILSTCYFFAFGNIMEEENFKTINVAYVSQDVTTDEQMKEVLESDKLSDGTPVFSVTYCNKAEAGRLLSDNKIDGYIIGRETPELYVKESGLNQTILKAFLDTYCRMSGVFKTITERNPEALNQGLLTDLSKFNHYITDLAKGKNKPDVVLIGFYSVLAYTCVSAGLWGLDEVINIQADQSNQGARVSVSPVSKIKLFFCNLSAAYLIHIINISLLFLHMKFILKINFGDHLALIFLTCILGSYAGLLMGSVIGIWIKKSKSVKEAILSAVTLGCSFLSGMMMVQIKYEIATKFPILSYINPINLITDAFYSLYYYDTYQRFIINILLLAILAMIFTVFSFIGIRRKNYAVI